MWGSIEHFVQEKTVDADQPLLLKMIWAYENPEENNEELI